MLSGGWRDIAQPDTAPRAMPEASRLQHAFGEVLDDLKGLMQCFPAGPVESGTLATFSDRLPRLAGDTLTPFRIVRTFEFERDLQDIDRGRSLAEIRR